MNKDNGLLRLRKALLTALLGGTMAAVQFTGAVTAYAQPVTTQSEAGKEEDSKNEESKNKGSKKGYDEATIARMAADWEKLTKEYTTYECNLPVEDIRTLLEVEKFIEDNYKGTLSNDYTADEVLAYRNELNQEFSYSEVIKAYRALDKTDDKAVADFLAKYGKRLAVIHAHLYYTLYTMSSAILRDLVYYVKQDVENTYGFNPDEFWKADIEKDLTKIYLYYKDENGKVKKIIIDITAPSNELEQYGAGFVDIQRVWMAITAEALYHGHFMNGKLEESEIEGYLAHDSLNPNGTTTNSAGKTEQVYDISHDEEVYNLLKEGLRVEETLDPATTILNNVDGVTEENIGDYDVTSHGYGHYFVTDLKHYYDEVNQMDVYEVSETIVLPTNNLEDVKGKDVSALPKNPHPLTLKQNN